LGFGGYLTPVFNVVLNPIIQTQRWISTRFITIIEFVRMPRDVAVLRQRNTELENEVARLTGQVIELRQQIQEVSVLYSLLDFARANPENEYSAALVIGKDPSPFLQYVFIDQGSDQDLVRGMPVVTSQGLVGRIDAVISGAARVQLMNDPRSVVNVKLQSTQTEALLVGSITGDIYLEMVPQDVPLRTGEIILTSGIGGTYPQNLLIGQVVNVRKRQNDLFQSASVQPVVDFSKIGAVLVIKNFKPIDISPLQPLPSR
jgi:rod shape-determining protein MreC